MTAAQSINTFILLEHKPAAMFAMFGWVVVLGKKRKQMYVCVCLCVCVSQFRNVFVWKIKTCLKMWQHGHVNVTALTCLNLWSTLGSSFAILHAQQNMSKKTSWIFFPPCPPPLNSRAELANLLAILNLSLLVDVICLPWCNCFSACPA